MTKYPELHVQTVSAAHRIEIETSVSDDDNDEIYNTGDNNTYIQ